MSNIDFLPEENASDEYLSQWLINRLGLSKPPSLVKIEAFRFAIKAERRRKKIALIKKPKEGELLNIKSESAKEIMNNFLRSSEFIMLLIFMYGTIELAYFMSNRVINSGVQIIIEPEWPKI